MRKIKKLIFVFVFLLSMLISGKASALDIAYVEFPPYEWEENGQAKGIQVEIVKKVFEKSGVPLNLKFMPFKRALEMTKAGEIDGLFNFYKIPERIPYFEYSEPLINNPLVYFIRKDSPLVLNSLSDIEGLNVGVIRGYTYGSDFDKSELFNKDETSSHKSNFLKLIYGRIDVYPCDKLVGIWVARNNGFMNELKILPTPLLVMKGHIGFTKGKNLEEIDKINKTILEMKESGEIKNIIDAFLETKEFGFNK